jgi:alkylated DNA repair protein alkB homolog 8
MFMCIHGFTLYIVQDQVKDLVPVSMTASDLNIPGLYLVHDFVSATEEKVY